MPPDISVIIAAHNVESYIERAMRSALNQQGVTVEVVVVNDGSTDGTPAAIARIEDPHVKRLDLSPNMGPSGARNAGIAVAAAPWIAILDGDDALLPDRLNRCLARAKMLNADIVVDNLDVCREADGARYPMFPPAMFSRLATLDLLSFIDGNQSFLGGGISLGYLKPVFSAAFLRQHALAYDPELGIGEDYMLMCEALAQGARCAVENTAGYLYTARAGSTSHRLTPADMERIAAADKKFCARYALDAVAAKAQKRREFGIKEAYAFTQLVEAIKRRDARSALKIIAARPTAAWHLWRPAWARIARV
jgi:succinoglycan biosynthesis protein ExoO